MINWLDNCNDEINRSISLFHSNKIKKGNEDLFDEDDVLLVRDNDDISNKTDIGLDGNVVAQEVLWYFAGIVMLGANKIKFKANSTSKCKIHGKTKLSIDKDKSRELLRVLARSLQFNFPESIGSKTRSKVKKHFEVFTDTATEKKIKENIAIANSNNGANIHGNLIDINDYENENRYKQNQMSYKEAEEYIRKKHDWEYIATEIGFNFIGTNYLKFLNDNGMTYNISDDSFTIDPDLIPNITQSLQEDIDKGISLHKDMRLYLLAGILENYLRYGRLVNPKYMRIFFSRESECESLAVFIGSVIGKKISYILYDKNKKKSFNSSIINLYRKDMDLLYEKLKFHFLGGYFTEALDSVVVTEDIISVANLTERNILKERTPLLYAKEVENRELRDLVKQYESMSGINREDVFKNTIITDTQTLNSETSQTPTSEDLKSVFSEDLIHPKSRKAPNKFDSAILRDIALEINDPEEAPIKSKPPKADEPKLISKDEADVFKKAEEIQEKMIYPEVDWRYAKVPEPTTMKERYFYDYKNESYTEEELKPVLASDPTRYDKKGIDLRGLKHSDILDKSRVYDIQRPKYDEVQFTVNVSKRDKILPLVPHQIIDLSRVDKLFAITVEDYVKALRPKFDNKYLIVGDLVELRKMQYQYFYYNNGIWNDDGDVVDKSRYELYESRLKLEIASLIKDMGFETEKQYDQWKFMYGPEDLMQTISSKYRGYDDKFMLKKLDDKFKEWQKRNLKM
jgi:hypothetical protein